MSDVTMIVLVAVAMVVGVVGTVLPFIPGLWLIWTAGLVYGLTTELDTVGWVALIMLTLLALVGTAAGVSIPQRSAGDVGLPWWGQMLAGALAVVGFLVVPVAGAALGFLSGVVLVSAIRTRELRSAIPIAWTIAKSLVVASAAQLAVGLTMFLVWIGWVVAA